MENENTKILKELEANSDMSLIQGEKMVNAVDGLEPALEGILMKADELVRETKNSKSQVVIRVEGDVESIKGEKGDTPEIDYDGINLKIAEMHKESMEVMQKELTDTVREDILTVAEAIKPELLHEVEEKIGEFGEVLLVDIKNVGDKVVQAESQIDVTDSNLKKLEERVDGIKIPTYDLSPFAKADDVTKEVNNVKKTIDDKVSETAKSIETLKGEVEKKVSDLEDEQMQRLQKVASKTVSLVELDDVNLDGLTQTNGKYDLGSGAGTSVVLQASITLTQAEINDLDTTPITIVDAQPDVAYIPIVTSFYFKYGSAAFTTTSGSVRVIVDAASSEFTYADFNSIKDATVDVYSVFYPSNTGGSVSNMANKAIQVDNPNATFANGTGGTLTIDIKYVELSTA